MGIVLFLALSAASPPKPDARLFMSPRLTTWAPEGREIRGVVLLTNVDEKLWCPRIEWYWSDGTTDAEEGDCDPFEDSTPQQRARVIISRARTFYGPQTVTLVVRITKAGKVLRRIEGTVEIK